MTGRSYRMHSPSPWRSREDNVVTIKLKWLQCQRNTTVWLMVSVVHTRLCWVLYNFVVKLVVLCLTDTLH